MFSLRLPRICTHHQSSKIHHAIHQYFQSCTGKHLLNLKLKCQCSLTEWSDVTLLRCCQVVNDCCAFLALKPEYAFIFKPRDLQFSPRFGHNFFTFRPRKVYSLMKKEMWWRDWWWECCSGWYGDVFAGWPLWVTTVG